MENNQKIQYMKEYLKMVFDIEGSLYQNQKMKETYIQNRRENEPNEPIIEKLVEPTKPRLYSEEDTLWDYLKDGNKQGKQVWHIVLFICAIGISIFMSIFALQMIVEILDDVFGGWHVSINISFFIKYMLWTIGFIALTIYSSKKIKQDYKNQLNSYKESNATATQKYTQELADYHSTEKLALKTYQSKYAVYKEQKNKYDIETKEHILKFEEIQNNLSNSLNNYYSKDLIYPKYRNLIAMATIYEYFASGRCNELEGPNGAYNLYESELRSNIIINSLSQIISDLNQIKNGQYALYEMINNSNAVICEMLSNMNKAQYLTAYFAKEAALAASADRYIVGRTYIW